MSLRDFGTDLRLMSLSALGIVCIRACPSHSQVINPKHLRYLDLSRSYMDVLPSSICTMYNLQTLRLNDCLLLTYLPEGMRTMSKLIHLYLLRCPLKRMPPNISLLKNLRTLTTFVLDTEPGRGIEELKDLNHLANRLELESYGQAGTVVVDTVEVISPSLPRVFELAAPVYFACLKTRDVREEEVLESLKPHAKLKILELHGYSGLKIPQWMKDPQLLQCLTNLHISNCPGCKDLSTVWFLVSLESLFLSKMKNLTTLFMNVAENTVGEADTILVTFPELAKLYIFDCPKLASVPDCPVLKELNSARSCSLAMSSLAHLTTLSELIYEDNERVRMSLGSWPSLTKLDVSSSYTKMSTLEVGTKQGPLENLRSLTLYRLNCFTDVSGFSKLHLGLWKCFAFVEDLSISGCDGLVRWPIEELMSLIHLQSLSIETCRNLEGKGSSSEDGQLHIPMLPASLEKLCLVYCPRLVALPSKLGNLARLKIMSLQHCYDLKELPDGMDGLISLEELKIWNCPEIEKFLEGGEYFDLVSSVQHIDISKPETELAEWPESETEQTESRCNKNKQLVKRLLPSFLTLE
uniref:Disease resistance R13L4/SHOC-2-like LRR domain-containing protein n=1 Tax=Oryza nivara TaxID=4536 RepID=A0A0E0G5D6_ORYNI